MRTGLSALSMALLIVAPAPVAAQATAPPAPAAPPQASCPTVANVDLRALSQPLAPTAAPIVTNDDLAVVVVPANAQRRPPADASMVIRTRLRPSGGHSEDERAVIWREADGSWWGWRRVVGGTPASPSPPATPGTPEAEQEAADRAAGYPITYESYPSQEGRLSAEQAALMEAAYTDPCRRLEPDVWPSVIPLLRRENGARVQRCDRGPMWHPGNMAYITEFTEAGGPPRRIGLRCGSAGTLNAALITNATHAGLPQQPSRRLTRDQVDAHRRWMECWHREGIRTYEVCGPNPNEM